MKRRPNNWDSTTFVFFLLTPCERFTFWIQMASGHSWWSRSFFSVSLKFASHIVLAEAYEGDALGSVAEGIGWTQRPCSIKPFWPPYGLPYAFGFNFTRFFDYIMTCLCGWNHFTFNARNIRKAKSPLKYERGTFNLSGLQVNFFAFILMTQFIYQLSLRLAKLLMNDVVDPLIVVSYNEKWKVRKSSR